jgi:hypothetical protein
MWIVKHRSQHPRIVMSLAAKRDRHTKVTEDES